MQCTLTSHKTVSLKVRSGHWSCLHRVSQIVYLCEAVTDVVEGYVHPRFSCLWITIVHLFMNPPFFNFGVNKTHFDGLWRCPRSIWDTLISWDPVWISFLFLYIIIGGRWSSRGRILFWFWKILALRLNRVYFLPCYTAPMQSLSNIYLLLHSTRLFLFAFSFKSIFVHKKLGLLWHNSGRGPQESITC